MSDVLTKNYNKQKMSRNLYSLPLVSSFDMDQDERGFFHTC
ncbi:3705_t:CDS:2 [Funneliformis geosporum]|nr:3705_t:CDS:2 [Funneliformis geosporum]